MPKTLPVIDMTDPICCAPVSASPLDDAAALEIALRLKALADPVRIKLMSILLTDAAGEVCTCDLATAVGLSEPTVSHHLGQLKKAGMVLPQAPRHECLLPGPRRRSASFTAGPRPDMLPLSDLCLPGRRSAGLGARCRGCAGRRCSRVGPVAPTAMRS